MKNLTLPVDQPVGTGFSRGDHPATNNAADTAAFVQWLGNFFNEFPALKSKKIHLLGESYAGIFVSTMPSLEELCLTVARYHT